MYLKSFLVVSIFFISLGYNFSQDYFLGQSKEIVLKELYSMENAGFEVYFFEKDLDVNNLSPMSVELKSELQNYNMDFLFNKEHKICVAVIIKYHCGECVEKDVHQILENKYLKWKPLSKNEYISGRIIKKVKTTDSNNKKVIAVASPHMKIVKDLDGEICAFVRLALPF